jgi:hypothetical protein
MTGLPARVAVPFGRVSSYGLLFFSAAVLRALASLVAVRLSEPGARSLNEIFAPALARGQALAVPWLWRLARRRAEAAMARDIAG